MNSILAGVAQQVEQVIRNDQVAGSTPVTGKLLCKKARSNLLCCRSQIEKSQAKARSVLSPANCYAKKRGRTCFAAAVKLKNRKPRLAQSCHRQIVMPKARSNLLRSRSQIENRKPRLAQSCHRQIKHPKKRKDPYGSKNRRRGDSNPRWSCPHTNVPGLHLKPLGHLSIDFCVIYSFCLLFYEYTFILFCSKI